MTIMLAGCTTTYNRQDIHEYMNNSDLKGETSESYEKVIGEDGYTDRVWTATDENGIEYHVTDNYFWGQETLQNGLRDDYEYSVLNILKDKYNYELQEDYSNQFVVLRYYFETREDIDKAYAELNEILKYVVQNYPSFDPSSVRYTIAYKNQYDSIYNSGDTQVVYLNQRLDNIEVNEEDIQDVIRKSQEYSLAMGDRESPILDRLTDAEIDNIIATQDNRIVDITDPDNIFDYPVLQVQGRWAISFGGLYNLLANMDEDFQLNGDFTHFTFVGIDGKTYEFQYSLNDLDYTQFDYKYSVNKDASTGYFYIVDGVQTPCDIYSENWLDLNKVQEITGRKLSVAYRLEEKAQQTVE